MLVSSPPTSFVRLTPFPILMWAKTSSFLSLAPASTAPITLSPRFTSLMLFALLIPSLSLLLGTSLLSLIWWMLIPWEALLSTTVISSLFQYSIIKLNNVTFFLFLTIYNFLFNLNFIEIELLCPNKKIKIQEIELSHPNKIFTKWKEFKSKQSKCCVFKFSRNF